MAAKQMKGKVQTVLGPVEADDLGITLTHEHLLVIASGAFKAPADPDLRRKALEPVSFQNIGWVRYHPLLNKDNLELTDESLALEEALRFREAGGRTIVDMTNESTGRNPAALVRIARATNLNIVMGTGCYTEATIPEQARRGLTEDRLTETVVSEIEAGVADTGIRAGVIGEIGTDWPITDFERTSLRAAVRAQQHTGAPMNVHSGKSPSAPFEILKVLEQEKADLSRVCVAHIDSRVFDWRIAANLAKSGVYLGYDSFSLEGWYDTRLVLSEENPVVCDIPNDAGRLNDILALVRQGFIRQILISHDHCMKHRMYRWGGPGYAHIPENVVPLMRRKGFTEEQMHTILVENPKRLMPFV
ncbi:MAG: TatD family hydrolase [Dehalococcoidia bacterium]|jgi:phosphotriesterase-related protein|nr:TatD family hydrolase [Dehalococcoidia bacterium]